MIKKKIFNNHINIFSPYSNEYIHDYINILGYSNDDLKDWKAKFVILNILKFLLELKVIYVFNWGNAQPPNIQDFSNEDVINHIDKNWIIGAKYPDFYSMAMFGSTKWYVDKLEELGMTHTTNWESFVSEKIGDLEKWIEENKPKYSITDESD